MFRKHSKQVERTLIDIVNNKNNINKCGECGSDYPTWASWNLGILLCGRCANVHKKALSEDGPRGGPISQVKSLTLENWTDEQVDTLRRIGNRKAKRRWNPQQVPFPRVDDDDYEPVARYFRAKYIEGKFSDHPDDYGQLDDRGSHYSGQSGALTPRPRNSRLGSTLPDNRSRTGSNTVPALSHRRLTTFEQTQYRAQVAKLVGIGFSDRDAVLESLILSDGNIDFALDILEHDAKTNPLLNELPPQLPRRPATSSSHSSNAASSGASAPTSVGTSADWWSGATSQQAQPTQPQIYQYTDPGTGQVSYVDSNGQQYLDTNNPQHQQLLMQQTMPQQLSQQVTKQSIMSLYNQTGSAPTAGQPQTVLGNQSYAQPPQPQMPIQTAYPQATGLGVQYSVPQQVYMQPTVQQQTGFYQPQQQLYGNPPQLWM